MADTSSLTQKERSEAATRENTRGGVFFTPRVDIYETDQELTLYADVPGVRPEDVDLRYEKGELLLHARVQPRHASENFLLQEYDEGDFYRAFTVHESIDASRIEAEFKNGVLIVHLPKAEAAKPKQITVRVKQGE
jgi:HSP20 family protein